MDTRYGTRNTSALRMRGLCAVIAGVLMVCPAAGASDDAAAALAELAQPLRDRDALTPLIERAGRHALALLGESTHGTAEYYTWRADISRRLVEEHGFSFIAVEGDWDACWRGNQYVKHLPGAGPSAEAVLRSFDRWPLWMWANQETAALVEWLHGWNADRPLEERVGFYGIDVYGVEGSMAEVLAYLEQVGDEEGLEKARQAYACLETHLPGHRYATAVMSGVAACEEPVAEVAQHLRERADALRAEDAKAWFNAKQHALVVRNAERHYRAMASQDGQSWNSRVEHFQGTIERLLEYHGEGAKGVVWAHNTHIGDARATVMAQAGRTNIGQLLRERYGDDAVFSVGFGTYRGTVLAGSAWEAPVERMTIPPAMPDSLEELLHRTGLDRLWLIFEPETRTGPLAEPIGQRAVGVVYHPARERFGNYVPTVAPDRYNAFIFFAETTPLSPLH